MARRSPDPKYRIPRQWDGATVVCIGGGPSLTPEDVAYCQGKARVVAVNNAYQLAPFADVIWGCDQQWWKRHHDTVMRDCPAALKFTLTQPVKPGVTRILYRQTDGLDLDPSYVATGKNGGYQAINYAVHAGAKRIGLLGYDAQRAPDGTCHWHPDHPGVQTPVESFVPHFKSLVGPLKSLGVEVVNCSRSTAIHCFPRMTIQEFLG